MNVVIIKEAQSIVSSGSTSATNTHHHYTMDPFLTSPWGDENDDTKEDSTTEFTIPSSFIMHRKKPDGNNEKNTSKRGGDDMVESLFPEWDEDSVDVNASNPLEASPPTEVRQLRRGGRKKDSFGGSSHGSSSAHRTPSVTETERKRPTNEFALKSPKRDMTTVSRRKQQKNDPLRSSWHGPPTLADTTTSTQILLQRKESRRQLSESQHEKNDDSTFKSPKRETMATNRRKQKDPLSCSWHGSPGPSPTKTRGNSRFLQRKESASSLKSPKPIRKAPISQDQAYGTKSSHNSIQNRQMLLRKQRSISKMNANASSSTNKRQQLLRRQQSCPKMLTDNDSLSSLSWHGDNHSSSPQTSSTSPVPSIQRRRFVRNSDPTSSGLTIASDGCCKI